MKNLSRTIYIISIHVFALIGVGTIIWLYNYYNGWNEANKTYCRNIIKVSKGMKIEEARSVMGELELDKKYHAKISYQMRTSSNDTIFVIVLSYSDGDHTDGSPALFINPSTARVEGVQSGIVF